MKDKLNVVFFHLEVPDFRKAGGGGAERQFSMLHCYLQNEKLANSYFLCTKKGLKNLFTLNIIKDKKGTYALNNVSGRFGRIKKIKSYLSFMYFIVTRRIDIVHVVNHFSYNNRYYKLLTMLPRFIRPKLIIQVMDCRMAGAFETGIETENNLLGRYSKLFSSVHIDGMFSWYENFVETAKKKGFVKSNPVMESAKFCFTDLKRFFPLEKKNVIVFAARLDNHKRPLLFLEALEKALFDKPELFQGYRLLIFGNGPLLNEVLERIKPIQQFMQVEHEMNVTDLAPYIAESKYFVSTQNLENFTSLSMLEAMACGNVIIARNVGQTSYFVRKGLNGFLCKNDDVGDLASTIIDSFSVTSKKLEEMGKESIKIAMKEHNVENFSNQLLTFWKTLNEN